MQITCHNLGCFTLRSKNVTIVTDPFDPKVTGVPLKKLKGDIVTLSREDQGMSTDRVGDGNTRPIVIDWPGEYEHKGISIIGTQTWQNKKGETGAEDSNTVYTCFIDDMHVCHLGKLGHALSTEQVDEIGDVDILMIPVGGIGSLDVQKAKEVIEKIEPRVVIPMYYAAPGAKEKLRSIDEFLKAFDDSPEKTDSLKILKRDLPSEEQTKIIIITPGSTKTAESEPHEKQGQK